MKTYSQQFEPWRPDCPPVWNGIAGNNTIDLGGRPCRKIIVNLNLAAFRTTLNAIDKAMRL